MINLIKTVEAMGWADKARFAGVLIWFTFMSSGIFLFMPIVILGWPFFLALFVIQMVGQALTVGLFTLISRPFRNPRPADPPERPALTPEQKAIRSAVWIGLFLGSLWGIYANWDLYSQLLL